MKNKTKQTDEERVLALLIDFIHSVERNQRELTQKGKLVDLCKGLFHSTIRYDAFEAQIKRLYHLKNHLEKVAIPEAFERDGSEKIAIPDLAHSFSLLTKYSASLVDRDEAFKWLRKIKAGELITNTVNAGTLCAFLRDRLLNKGEDPPECIKFTNYKTTGINKYIPKKGEKTHGKSKK